jgi:CPA1 family monovalent cation:H+ antiporter
VDGDGAATSATAGADGRDGDAAVVRAATEAQRRRLVALRADGTIGDAAFQRVEEELDWAELDWSRLVSSSQS